MLTPPRTLTCVRLPPEIVNVSVPSPPSTTSNAVRVASKSTVSLPAPRERFANPVGAAVITSAPEPPCIVAFA